MATPTENNWHNAPLSRLELVKVIEHCNDASTETACLLLDSTQVEIVERLDAIEDALVQALVKIKTQRAAFIFIAHEEGSR